MLLNIHENLSVIAEAGNYADAVKAVFAHEIDVAILDLSMPGRDGVELIRHVKSVRPTMKILVLSAHSEPSIVARALRAKINGFVAKENAVEDVVAAIHEVVQGRRYVCSTISRNIAMSMIEDMNHENLSGREYKVFEMLVAGKRGKQIANELSLSPKTISTHKTHIFEKLRLQGDGELLRYALRHNLAQM